MLEGQELAHMENCQRSRIDVILVGILGTDEEALANIGGALCSTPQSLADAHY